MPSRGGPARGRVTALRQRRREPNFEASCGSALHRRPRAPGLERAVHALPRRHVWGHESGGPDDKAALLAELIDAAHLVVTHDAAIALAGATCGEPGIITIAGTGSMAFGKNARGETARAGGWGYIYGDEGGAFDVVRQAVRAVLREHEGWGGRTALTPALLEASGAPDPNAMLHLFYTPEWPRWRVAGLAKIVHRIATEGDPAALRSSAPGEARSSSPCWLASVRRQLWGRGGSWCACPGRDTFQHAILCWNVSACWLDWRIKLICCRASAARAWRWGRC